VGWRASPVTIRHGLGADRFPARVWTLAGEGSSGLGVRVVRGKSEEEGTRPGEGESTRASPSPTLSSSTGAHFIIVGPRIRPTIPSSHLVPWMRSGVGGGGRYKSKPCQTKAKGKIKASQTKAKMSSSGSVEVAPAPVDHSGEHGGPSGTSPAPAGGVIPGVALPASKAGDAPPPSLLAPTMLVRLYRVVVGVLPAPPEDVNTAERLQGFLAMRPVWVE